MTELLSPLSELGWALTPAQQRQLVSQGVVTLAQFYEVLQTQKPALATLGIDADNMQAKCIDHFSCLRHEQGFGCVVQFRPSMGWVLDPQDSQTIMQHRQDTQSQRKDLAQRAARLAPQLPESFLLTEGMCDVRDQGDLGSCTGFGSAAAREFLLSDLLSPGFLYRGAKMIDGMPHTEGSYQQYCYNFMVNYGNIPDIDYTYEQCLNNVSIEPWLEKARRYSINNYLDLIVESKHQSTVLKAVLCGAFSEQLSSRPVSISLALYEGFFRDSAYRYGLIPLPFPNEELQGGHAMVVCGWVKLYSISYFVVQNSWGPRWAKNNPLNLPGYALIPEVYINTPKLVGELLTPL